MACPACVRRATFQRGIFHGVSFGREIDWPIRLQRVVCSNKRDGTCYAKRNRFEVPSLDGLFMYKIFIPG